MKSEIADSRKSSSTGNIFRLNTPGFCQENTAENARDISVDVGSSEAKQLFKQSSAVSGLFFLLFDFSRPLKIVFSLAFVAVMLGGLLNYLSSNEISLFDTDRSNNEAELVNFSALAAPATGAKTESELAINRGLERGQVKQQEQEISVEVKPQAPASAGLAQAQLQTPKQASSDDMGFQMVVAADIANHLYALDLPRPQDNKTAIANEQKNKPTPSVDTSEGQEAELNVAMPVSAPVPKSQASSEPQRLASKALSAPTMQINQNQANVERKLIERSQQLVRKGRLSQAQIELGAGLARLAESAPVLLELNRLFIKSKSWSAAQALFEANAWLPETALAQGTAELLYAQGDYRKAMFELELHSPDVDGNESFYLLKASVLRKLKKFAAAEVIYRQLLTLEPRKGSYWLGLAICQDFSADPSAFNSYGQALKFNRGYPKVVTYIQSRMKILNVFRSKTVIAKQGF